MAEHSKSQKLELDMLVIQKANPSSDEHLIALADKLAVSVVDSASSIDRSSAIAINKLVMETSAVEVLRREAAKYQNLTTCFDPKLHLLGQEYSLTVFAHSERERLSKLLDSNFMRDVNFSRQAAWSMKDFRIPADLEISRVLAAFGKGGVTEWLEREKALQLQWSKQFESIQTGWANMATEVRSVRAFTELQGLGAALKSFDGFEQGLAAALRTDLGDWRSPMDFAEDVLVEPFARRELYIAQGFDAALTDFPEPAYSQGLAVSGLCIDYFTDSELAAFVPIDIDEEAAAAFRRAHFCFQLLYKLERKLRRFVDETMTSKFGANWAKHRLPTELYLAWQEKAEKARVSGEILDSLIEAADFTDYERIICKKDNFAELFKPYFRDASSVRESFNRLRPLRIATMHSRFVTKDDLLFVLAESTRLLKAMGG
jgi:hypothetical protein